ncbi:MAG TPA: hypothetical protein VLJ21_00325 [Candidatus Binatia bacterium]|nr:hypothetical protein [Candidatus Binatia bacterium]
MEEFTVRNVRDLLRFTKTRWTKEFPYLARKIGEREQYHLSDLCAMLPEPSNLAQAKHDLQITAQAVDEGRIDLAELHCCVYVDGAATPKNVDAFVNRAVSVNQTTPQATSSIKKTPEGELWSIRHGVLTPEMTGRIWSGILAATKAVGHEYLSEGVFRANIPFGLINPYGLRDVVQRLESLV